MNGDVKCFTGGHTGLAILSILVLLTAVVFIPGCLFLSLGHVQKVILMYVYTPYLLQWCFFHKFQLPQFLRLFMMPMTSPYRHCCKWWSAVELTRRLVLLLLIVTLPGNEVGSHFYYQIIWNPFYISGSLSTTCSSIYHSIHLCSTIQIKTNKHDWIRNQLKLSCVAHS